MKQLVWISVCASLALGCGGDDDGKKRSNGDEMDDGGSPRSGDGGIVPGKVDDDAGDRRDRGDGGVSTSGDGSVSRGDAGMQGEPTGAVDPALVVSALDSDQRERLCRTLMEHYFATVDFDADCTLDGVFETTDASACEAYASECAAESRRTRDSDTREAIEGCAQGLSTCSYTVDEVTRCSQEADEALKQAASMFSCSEAGDYEFSEYPEPEPSATCLGVIERCAPQ